MCFRNNALIDFDEIARFPYNFSDSRKKLFERIKKKKKIDLSKIPATRESRRDCYRKNRNEIVSCTDMIKRIIAPIQNPKKKFQNFSLNFFVYL